MTQCLLIRQEQMCLEDLILMELYALRMKFRHFMKLKILRAVEDKFFMCLRIKF